MVDLWRRRGLLLAGLGILIGLAGCASAVTSSVQPTATLSPTDTPLSIPTLLPLMATPEPAATATPQPSSTPLPATGYQVSAWVARARPKWGSMQTVFGQLLEDEQGISGVPMYCVVHYRGFDRRWPESGYAETDSRGIASVTFDTSDAGEYTVEVDVYLLFEGETYLASTSFVPDC